MPGPIANSEERGVIKSDLDEAENRLRTEMNAMEERLRRHLTTRIYGAAAFVAAVLGILNYVMG